MQNTPRSRSISRLHRSLLWAAIVLVAGGGSLPACAGSETDVLLKNETAQATKTYPSKRGKVVVETYKKADFDRFLIRTSHYQIYSELKPDEFPPQELGMLMEAMFEQYCRFFAVTPDLKGARWQIEMYASPERFQRLMNVGANGIFYEHTRKAHSHRINGPLDWTLKLMVHEATHQFHALSGVTHANPVGYGSAMQLGFMNEGIATFGEGTLWDAKTETVRIGYPLPGRSASGRNKSAQTPRTFDDMIMHYIDRDVDFNVIMFLVHRRTRQAAQLFRDTRPAPVAWRAAFGSLEMDSSFWKDFEEFVDIISDPQNEEKGLFKDIAFTSWKDMIEKNEVVDHVVTLRRVCRLLGDRTPASVTDLTNQLEPLSRDRSETARKQGIADYNRRLDGMVRDTLAAGHVRGGEAAALLIGCSATLTVTSEPDGTLCCQTRGGGAYQSAVQMSAAMSIASGYDGRTLGTSLPNVQTLQPEAEGLSTWKHPLSASDPAVVRSDVTIQWRGQSLVLHDEVPLFPSIGKWRILGPFDNQGDATVDTVLPPETEPVDLSKTYTGMAQPRRLGVKDVKIAWTPADRPRELAADREYVVKIPYSERAAAYAVTWIDSAREQKAVLALGADDGIMAWLNNQEVCRQLRNSQVGYRSMEFREPVTLRKGMNKLLVKITQSGWGWEFGGHLLDPSGEHELSGIRCVSKPALPDAAFPRPTR